MSTEQKLTPELHKKQVEAYVRELLVPWRDLSDDFRDFDIKAVLSFPEVLVMEGLQISRRRTQ